MDSLEEVMGIPGSLHILTLRTATVQTITKTFWFLSQSVLSLVAQRVNNQRQGEGMAGPPVLLPGEFNGQRTLGDYCT